MQRRWFSALLLAVFTVQIAFILVSQVQTVSAEPAPYGYIELYDVNGNVRNEFMIGEKAGIRTNLLFLYIVRVIDPDGVVAYTSWQLWGEFDSGLLDCMTTKTRSWQVRVNSLVCCHWRVRTDFNVVPLGSFGALGMLAVGFGTFGAKSLVSRRRSKN